MALLLPTSTFFHIPKTGGQWVARALEAAGVPTEEIGPVHADPTEVAMLAGGQRRRHAFAFVRHPLSWYPSIWAHRLDENWDPIDDPDWFTPAWVARWREFSRVSRADTFDRFVRQLVDRYPDGFVSALFDEYTPHGTHVGRQESLAEDLVRILTDIGEPFDERALRATPEHNVRARAGRRRNRIEYCEETIGLVMAAESQAVNRFGYESLPEWIVESGG